MYSRHNLRHTDHIEICTQRTVDSQEFELELDNEAMMASKRCSSIKLLSLTFVSKSISKSLLIKNNYCYDICLNYVIYDFIKIRTFLEKMVLIWTEIRILETF